MMDFEKSSFVKLISENPGDPDPLKRATEFLLKTIIKKRFKGKLQFLQNLKSQKLCQDLDTNEGKNDGSKKVNSQLPPYSRLDIHYKLTLGPNLQNQFCCHATAPK